LLQAEFQFALLLHEATFPTGGDQPLAHLFDAEQADRVLPTLPGNVIGVGKRLAFEAVEEGERGFPARRRRRRSSG